MLHIKEQIIIGYGDSINLCRINLVKFILTTCSIAPRIHNYLCVKTLPSNIVIVKQPFKNLDRVWLKS